MQISQESQLQGREPVLVQQMWYLIAAPLAAVVEAIVAAASLVFAADEYQQTVEWYLIAAPLAAVVEAIVAAASLVFAADEYQQTVEVVAAAA
ncbi:hypothetical protein NC653_008108 [Populus alba x Populus x berolinensis]|uniref:Uncharacterized protein n=1 Tax=Populus alba x Populus x berolinensis TaxID=444605 RepID=A0AAD6R5Z9_9ROSI|nr:hypothetical protein NC653_008108 [Populus alba x Populus x berolinensis]